MINKKLKIKLNGFSLIELMIAMLIGILMLTAAVGLFMSNKRMYNEQNEMGRVQENARFAIDLLSNDIRMASYGGCVDDLSALTSSIANAGTLTHLHNATNAIEGIDDKAVASTWSPSNSNEQVTGIVNGTDAITVRYLEPIPNSVQFTTGSTMANGTAAIPVTCYNAAGAPENCDADHITAGENLAISNCTVGDIFAPTGTTNSTITHGATLSAAYTDAAQVSRYVTTRYYIGTATNTNQVGNAVPALYRYTTSQDREDWDGDTNTAEVIPHAEELIEGVERMEILYGVDTDADGIPNSYLAAGAAGLTSSANWANVVSVQIALLVRTIDVNVNIENDENTYTLLNAAAYDPVNEKYRRRMYTATIQIRNRIPST